MWRWPPLDRDGARLEPDTFMQARGSEVGVPHHSCGEAAARPDVLIAVGAVAGEHASDEQLTRS